MHRVLLCKLNSNCSIIYHYSASSAFKSVCNLLQLYILVDLPKSCHVCLWKEVQVTQGICEITSEIFVNNDMEVIVLRLLRSLLSKTEQNRIWIFIWKPHKEFPLISIIHITLMQSSEFVRLCQLFFLWKRATKSMINCTAKSWQLKLFNLCFYVVYSKCLTNVKEISEEWKNKRLNFVAFLQLKWQFWQILLKKNEKPQMKVGIDVCTVPTLENCLCVFMFFCSIVLWCCVGVFIFTFFSSFLLVEVSFIF